MAPGEATTYTCSHLLTSVGSYVNEATVTGSSADGTRVTHTSNQVVVDVASEPGFTIEKLQEISGVGTAFTSSPLTGKLGQTVDYEILVTNTGNEALTLFRLHRRALRHGHDRGRPRRNTAAARYVHDLHV